RYKSEFLANMSHELRTPLNSIMILSKILADNDERRLDDKQVEFAGLIHKSGEELLALINDVLDLAKVEAGKQSLVCAPMATAAIVDYVRRMFEPLAIQKQLGFEVTAATDVPDEIRTDWKRLSQIVKNLVANAFKFTERGRVTVRIDRAESIADRPAIAIAVTDTGIGIAPDKHARIFEAFAQIEGGTSRKYGGTGLGLTIARDLANNLGGDLTVGSELGRGSTFRVTLPVDGPPSDPQARRVEPPALQLPSLAAIADDRDGLVDGETCVLVIEDDVAFATVVSHLVREASMKVVVAQRGRIGIDLARRYRPSGIILDVGLPDLDGWAVMEALRSDPTTREIPVHFITASKDADRAMRLGAVGFSTKPVDAAQVRSALHALDRASRVGVRRVLLVEVDDASRESLRSLLAGGALEVEAVATPKEALARLAVGAYGCIVTNLALPDKSRGFELLASVRAEPATASIPIVVHTSEQLDVDEIRRLEADDGVIVVLEGERAKERVLDETRMFVERVRAETPVRGPAPNEAVLAALDGKTVLVVDDDMRNVYSLSSALRAKNLTVLTAADGQEALDELDRHPDTDVVLMDVMMPRMDGHEATRRIRVQTRFRDLPIIALTAKTMPGEREKCIDAGANDYVPKPVDVSRLLALLRVWLA
ncbi:MAG TPA: response regulator, partial [Kofleriaceae bacterium]|nr:response regulator [Kofleriaceae bacterium]